MTRDALGYETTKEYDVMGNCIKTEDANGNTETYTYDGNGNCITGTNAEGTTTYHEYDSMNRLIRSYIKKEDREVGISYEYDAIGRTTKITDEAGGTTTMTYDANNNLLTVTNEMGVVTENYTYNRMNQKETGTDARGTTTTYSYNGYGELIKAVEQLNAEKTRTHTYEYDLLGNMEKTTTHAGGEALETTKKYDRETNTETITDANGGTTTYKYDSMNRVKEETNAIGSSNKYTYNSVGLLKNSTNARKQKTSYTYDANGRIKTAEDEEGKTIYTYDANGNVLTVEEKEGTITKTRSSRTYDSQNRIKTYTDYKGRTVDYAYDELGNLISLTYPGGEIIRYEYYDNSLLKTVTDHEGRKTTYEYDPCRRLTKTTRADNTEEIRTYDEAGQLLSITDGEYKYEYTYDEAGNIIRTKETEPEEDISKEGVYNTAEGITKNINCEMKYNAANHLICYNGKEISYDADGNMLETPIEGELTSLKYDCRNRLTKEGETTYKYDAENIRIQSVSEEKTIEYVTDKAGRLSKVLVEYEYEPASEETINAEPIGTVIYVYGNGLISQESEAGYFTYHYNNLGSTTRITDEFRNNVETFTYGTYGELLNGTTENTHYLYNGQYGVSTEDNGLYYMRQRYYNPEIKRFINQDVVTGSINNSQSLNRYCYVQGNPVSLVDPFGLFPLSPNSLDHTIFGLLGMLPVVGIVADAIDCGLYIKEGDTANAIMSSISITPIIGQFAAAKLIPKIKKAKKTGEVVQKTTNAIEESATFLSKTADVSKYGDEVAEILTKGITKYGDEIAGSADEAVELALDATTDIAKGTDLTTEVVRKADLENGVTGQIADVVTKSDGNNLKRINVGNSGHHVPAVRKSKGRPFEVSRSDKTRPTIFSKGSDPGHDHWRLHDAERKFVGTRQGDFIGTDDELFDAYRSAYKGLDDIKVDVKSPNGTYVLGTDITPYEAVDLIQMWLKEQDLY